MVHGKWIQACEIADNSKFVDMFCDVTLAMYHQNRAMTEVKDI